MAFSCMDTNKDYVNNSIIQPAFLQNHSILITKDLPRGRGRSFENTFRFGKGRCGKILLCG